MVGLLSMANAQKTETMTISRKKSTNLIPSPLYMDNNYISSVSEHIHLGLVISDNMSWENTLTGQQKN